MQDAPGMESRSRAVRGELVFVANQSKEMSVVLRRLVDWNKYSPMVSNLHKRITTMSKPNINVTPLIDVLLVLLIIFMVVAPLKPSSFKARVPAEPKDVKGIIVNPKTLVVIVNPDYSLTLNNENNGATVNDTSPLIDRLKQVFTDRLANGDVSESFAEDPNRPTADKIERTVFIKAPKTIDYGSVARVVDAVKLAGAYPISLQIDHLE